LADLWAFDPMTAEWTLLDDGGGGGPPARMAHSLVYDVGIGDVVLVGGIMNDDDTALDDVWHYAGGWTEITTTPSTQAYHQMVITDDGSDRLILISNGEVWSYE
jgi:hypothetical protein